MPRLVTKFGYLKQGKGKSPGGYARYISTREGVEKISETPQKTYADYIATRPRAERFGTHGLFTDEGEPVVLSRVSGELNAYSGNIYTAILSLHREDAARLGFDSATRWRDFLCVPIKASLSTGISSAIRAVRALRRLWRRSTAEATKIPEWRNC